TSHLRAPPASSRSSSLPLYSDRSPRTWCPLFSLSCSRDPPALHSFPTRRSSDLPSARSALVSTQLLDRRRTGLHRMHRSSPCGRSEEHTSELQSPYDLVCRLLLEKKKTTIID